MTPLHDCPAYPCPICEATRARLTVPMFPSFEDGVPLGAMRVSSDPERFIYGDSDTLGWVREALSGLSSKKDQP